jgi:hypothetical protein
VKKRKHSDHRLEQWKKYYQRNQTRIRASVEERREYNRKANRKILGAVGRSHGCSECKDRFYTTNEVNFYYNVSCPHFGALLAQKVHTLEFLEKFTPIWGRFLCSSCFNEFINIKGNSRKRAYRIAEESTT